MSFKDLANKAKHLIVEDDETPKTLAPHANATVSAPYPAFNLGSMGAAVGVAPATVSADSPFEVPNTVVLDEKVYQSVFAKTNFDTTSAGKVVHKYFNSLEGSAMSTDERLKTAMKQASTIDNISADQVLAAYDQMQSALEADAADFHKVADGVQANQITARQTKIAVKQQQVETINAEITQLQTELISEQNNYTHAVQQYGLAEQRRAQEIAGNKAHFAVLLTKV
jgi:hypothetical protein